MDGERFDDLIRRFCTTRLTRISALRGLVAGAAAALTGATLASDETDAKKKGGKGRAKSESRVGAEAKGKSGGKKKGGKKGKKQQPKTTQRLQTEQEPLCAEGHVGLCHNSTNDGGGVVQCPDGSSSNLAGHCGHNEEDKNPFDCYCPGGGFDPNVHCPDADPQLQECFDCSGDGSCFFECVPSECPQPDPGDQCKEAVCINNACAIQNKPNGTTCDDGLFCTVDDVCTGGVCGGSARDCSAETDQCNLGVCDEDANACVKQPTPGESCNDGLFCTVGDTCDANGVCGGTPRDCSAAGDQCNDGVCNEEANECQARPKPDGTECNDGLFCTVNDVCTGGVCGGSPRDCSAETDQCNLGVCDEAADACVKQPTPGESCNDGLFCTVDDTCDAAGVCGGSPRDCSAETDQCNLGVCDEAADACVKQPTPGESCNDGLFCTVDDTCDAAGVCGGSPRVCPSDDCNDGVCDEANDACVLDPKDDNTTCGTNGEDICCGGVCTDNDTNENCGTCGNTCECGCGDGICLACGCEASCTHGYYKNNTCRWPGNLTPASPLPCANAPAAFDTFGEALAAKGQNIVWAQRAAAILNLTAFGCTADPNADTVAEICVASNAVLDAANQHDPDCCATASCADPTVCRLGRTCTLRGCGNNG